MKTVISLKNNDFIKHLDCASAKEHDEYIDFSQLCVDNHKNFWEIHFEVKKAEAIDCLSKLRRSCAEKLGGDTKQIVFRPKYLSDVSLAKYLETHWSDIQFDISCESSVMLKLFEPCEWVACDNVVEIKVSDKNTVDALYERKCDAIIKKGLKRDTSKDYEVKFVAGNFDVEIQENLERHREEIREEEKKKLAEIAVAKEKIIYNKGKLTPLTPITISELVSDAILRKPATIRGKVLSYYAPDGSRYSPEKFVVTDFTSSIECVIKPNNRNGNFNHPPPKPVLKIKEDEWVMITGTLDKSFNDQLEFRPAFIERLDDPVRLELSEDHRIELHAHTKMSQMDGQMDVEAFIKRAARWNHPAVGITDHGNVHIFPEAYSLGRKHNVRILFGIEGYLTNHTKEFVSEIVGKKSSKGIAFSKEERTEFKKDNFHIVIYAKNSAGLKNLYKLVSCSHTEYFYSKPLIPREVLEELREGLIIGSACEAGEIYRLVLNNYCGRITDNEFNEKIEKAIKLYDYLEVQPLANNAFYVSNGILKSEEDLIKINKKIYELGKKFGKLVIATCDVHLLDKHDMILRRILHAGQGFDVSEQDAPLFFMTTDEMLEEFSYFGEEVAREIVIENSNKIRQQIEKFPPIPDGFYPPTLENAKEDLQKLCDEKCKKLYGDKPHPLVAARYNREFDDIVKNRFADLYMLSQKIVQKSLDDGYIVGSRGSVGSSFVAFLSGITEVNSLPAHYTCPECFFTEFINYDENGNHMEKPLDKITAEIGVDLPLRNCSKCGAKMNRRGFDIPFETFVGFKGDKTPDIDLNFASEYQPRAHRYVEELFGKENVYRAGTFSTLQSRTAFGFVKKYVESIGADWPTAEINRLVDGLTGIKKTTGQHPGGMIILPKDKDINEFCPVQFPANKMDSVNKTTHFDYHPMEDQLLKLDILGHDDPTQIRLLSDFIGKDVTKAPLDDKKTLGIFSGLRSLGVTEKDIGSKVGTYGVPEFGTDFVRQMLADTRPKSFADLIRISGLSHGTDVWLNNARDLLKEGKATLKQAICTRDDIMNDLIAKDIDPFMAFKIMEQVRKGKGLKKEDVEVMKEKKIPDWYIESCKKIKYMFPKAHAVAYVLNAFRIAYCKVHYPVEFYAAYFTVMRHALDAKSAAAGSNAIRSKIQEILLDSGGRRKLSPNDKTTLTVLEVALEMNERGIKMLPIDVYKSLPGKCVIEDGKIIPPLTSFPGLGESAAESLVKARKKEKFSSRQDIINKTSVNKTIVENMAAEGLLNGMPESNQMDMWEMAAAPSPSNVAYVSNVENEAHAARVENAARVSNVEEDGLPAEAPQSGTKECEQDAVSSENAEQKNPETQAESEKKEKKLEEQTFLF